MPQKEFIAFLISACLGALIGLERQWEDQREGAGLEPRAGLRTFVLWALLGTTSAYIAQNHVPGFYPFGFSALVLTLLARGFPLSKNKRALGLTTFASALLTFFVGSIVFWGEEKLSVVLAVSMLLLLA